MKNQNSKLGKRTILWYLKDLFNLKTNAMKKLSILTTSFLAIGFALFVIVSETNAQDGSNEKTVLNQLNVEKPRNKIEVAFTNTLTFDSLVYIKNDLRTKGISVNYKKIEFDENNRLQAIECEVDCNDGFKGSFAIGSLNSQNKNKKIGFYRDYSKNAAIPFGTGGLKN